ncbi:NADPH-dependent 2,4-dienoyl-CoA reductase, sulfur reductase [Nakamurella panacisegetis]|uniref:NADPH-dependent 2,4-dienoyl-CoA reductase, sulfur reductase n=1 Tax=Nakamurella panacisegetis TaxID=1090615 RepID=A0A1H0N0X6_9ACTN|nr:FAD-dependent oxidoreductase [Nakamurella panacisegetis]SDO86282.1 NADPH-dependent 2,4-dienoyl-CoA reductase, sulfur reductase [Nakamurella panacisegetis]
MTGLPTSVTVVGAGLAGHATAKALRQQGFTGTITVIGDESVRPYDRPPLSKDFLAGLTGVSELALELEDEALDAQWVLGVHAIGLDPVTRTVALDDGTLIASDAVVIATGSRARRMPGAPAGVHTVRTLADAAALREELKPGVRLAVIGAGFIGAEIASTARGLGIDVTVIEAAPAPLAGPLGPEMGRVVAGLHEANGVALRCGVAVAGLLGTERVTGVLLADGTEVPADVVVAGIGAVPAVEWLEGSGLDLAAPGSGGGVVCDAVGATNFAGVFAVGDCSAWFDDVRGRHHRIEHWTDSRDRPAVMVGAMLGHPPTTPLRPPYFWSDQYGVKIQFTGRRDGTEEVTIEAGSAETHDILAVYRRDGEPVAVLGMNQPKLFTRWRKQLSGPPGRVVPSQSDPSPTHP